MAARKRTVAGMVNSRNLADLRADVRTNVEKLLALCEQQGLRVLITQTVRDNEYQAYLYEQGRTRPGSVITNSRTTTFHGKGLAVDFCENVKGHEYDDAAFFRKVATIAKTIGFSWGGDWKSFVDKPHLQWDNHGQYTTVMLRAGITCPMMPTYQDQTQEENMDQATFDKMMETHRDQLAKQSVAGWARAAWEKLTSRGITDGSRPADLITRQEVAAMIDRAIDAQK